MTKTLPFLSFCALSALFGSACGGVGAVNTPTASTKLSHPPSPALSPNLVKLNSALTDGQPSPWKVGLTTVNGRESLKAVYFLDGSRGWAGGRGSLNETLDGGRTWRRVNLDIPQGATVAGISFSSPSVGWVLLQKKPSEDIELDGDDIAGYREVRSWLMHTGDGGQSWQLQHEAQSSALTKVSFINEREGWMAGNEITGRSYHLKNLLFYTSDGGAHWLDVSGALNQITENENGYRSSLRDLKVEGPRTATVLSLGGEIFKTDNAGLSWQQLTGLRGDIGKYYFKLGLREDNHWWVMGGNYGAKGIFGTLAFKQGKNSWIESSLDGAYFKDAVILSSQQALACGLIPVYKGGARTTYDLPEQRDGTIFYTSDGGHSWTIIYRNPQITSVNALAAIDSDQIWAVGEDGLIIHLELPSSLAKN